jgi:hypothetical protein
MKFSFFPKLKKWLGVKDSINIIDRPERGCCSSKKINRGDRIVSVKISHIIQYNSIEKLYPGLEEEIIYANSLVAMHLLIESMNDNSFWTPYLESLPQDIQEFAVLNTNLDMGGLTSGFLYKKYIEELEEDASVIYGYCVENNLLTNQFSSYEEFYTPYIRFRLLVGSRIFGFNETSGLVPYIDLFNHSFEKPNSMWTYEEIDESFVLYAIDTIEPGTEICDLYGHQTNFELYMYYGFVLDSNPYRSIWIDGIELNEKTGLEDIDYSSVLAKANQIYSTHSQRIKEITNPNIAQLYLDEMKVIKNLFGLACKIKVKIDNNRIMV